MPQSVVRPYGLFAALKRSRWRAPGTGPSLPTLDVALFALAVFLALVLFGKFFIDPLLVAHPRQWPQPFAQFLGALTAFGKSDWTLLPLAALLLGAIAAGTCAATRADKLIFTSAGLRVFFLIAAIGLPGLIASILKPLAGRVRPFVRGEIDPFVYEPLAYFRELELGSMPFPEYFYGSMPSGHAANVVAAAIAFGALWPMFRPWLWAFAVVIMATRLGIGVHHFTCLQVRPSARWARSGPAIFSRCAAALLLWISPGQ